MRLDFVASGRKIFTMSYFTIYSIHQSISIFWPFSCVSIFFIAVFITYVCCSIVARNGNELTSYNGAAKEKENEKKVNSTFYFNVWRQRILQRQWSQWLVRLWIDCIFLRYPAQQRRFSRFINERCMACK